MQLGAFAAVEVFKSSFSYLQQVISEKWQTDGALAVKFLQSLL